MIDGPIAFKFCGIEFVLAEGKEKAMSRDDLFEMQIVAEQYYVFPGTTVTACCLSLQNGYSVMGGSVFSVPSEFDPAVGEQKARASAIDKLIGYEAYTLCNKIAGRT